MKNNYTHIAMVLDRSFSMENTKKDTIEGFNAFLTEQKQLQGKATITLVQFDHEFDILEEFKDLQEVKLLTEKRYVPRGRTALRDSVGLTINLVSEYVNQMKEDDRPDKVIICVLTDGFENDSKEFSAKSLKKLIKQKEKESWDFVFIGADQDAMLNAKDLGINANMHNSMSYAATSAGTRGMYNTLTQGITRARTSDLSTPVVYFDENVKNS